MPFRRTFLPLAVVLLLTLAAAGLGDPPANYYSSVTNFSDPAILRQQIHEVIDDHQYVGYSSGANSPNWDELEAMDENPSNSSEIVDIYRNRAFTKQGGGNSFYNREHTWPNSYGLNNGSNSASGSGRYPYSDLHHLNLSDDGYNSARSNLPFGIFDTATGLTQQPTDLTNGVGGGGGTPFPGDSNWHAGSGNTGRWQVWSERRGDVARGLMYLDVRYDGSPHSIDTAGSNELEPDLILTDNTSLIGTTDSVSDPKRAWMGELNVLIKWHLLDPVDSRETRRNDLVGPTVAQPTGGFQGNRNPFIDHPEWAAILWGYDGAPAVPQNLAAVPGDGQVTLDWDDNADLDLGGYDVFRSSTSAVSGFAQINASLAGESGYVDSTVSNGTQYWYKVQAVDLQSPANSSGDSNVATATPTGSGGGSETIVLAAVSTRNSSSASNEFIVLANQDSTPVDLAGWSLGTRGGGATSTTTFTITSGTIPASGHFIIGSPNYGGTVEGIAADFTPGGSGGLFGGMGDTTGRSISLFDDLGAEVDGFSFGGGADTPAGLGEGTPSSVTVTDGNTQSYFRIRPGGTTGPYQDTDDNASDIEVRTQKTPPNDSNVPVSLSGFILQ